MKTDRHEFPLTVPHDISVLLKTHVSHATETFWELFKQHSVVIILKLENFS